jgi:hypothetical protein
MVFLGIFTFETAAKPLASRVAINLRVGGPRIQALTTINHWAVQNDVYVLQLKVAKEISADWKL